MIVLINESQIDEGIRRHTENTIQINKELNSILGRKHFFKIEWLF